MKTPLAKSTLCKLLSFLDDTIVIKHVSRNIGKEFYRMSLFYILNENPPSRYFYNVAVFTIIKKFEAMKKSLNQFMNR